MQSQLTPRSTTAFPRRGSAAQQVAEPDAKPEPEIEPTTDEASEATQESAESVAEAIEPIVPSDIQEVDEQAEERGRGSARSSDADLESDALDEVDVILDEVRTRLYSVQKIVRREQSGSSQARDKMMDELGTMLDNAIATTITPTQTRPVTRGSSMRRPSPKKASPVASTLGRSQSVKVSGSSPLKVDQGFASLSRSNTTSPSRQLSHLQIPESPYRSITPIEIRRRRQSSEPGTFLPRRTGFPLASPVRERALL